MAFYKAKVISGADFIRLAVIKRGKYITYLRPNYLSYKSKKKIFMVRKAG